MESNWSRKGDPDRKEFGFADLEETSVSALVATAPGLSGWGRHHRVSPSSASRPSRRSAEAACAAFFEGATAGSD